MLKHLTIQNYALIESLEMHPDQHLNVITGETGAGKSIMLGAVGLLLGNRADTRVLLKNESKCVVEGEFDLSKYALNAFFQSEDLEYEEHTIIRREISVSGKSRAFVNDSPVTLDVLKSLGSFLMDVHSQHENLQLGNGLYQLKLIDIYAGNQTTLEDYKNSYGQYKQEKKNYDQLTLEAEKLRQEADYNSFLLKELEEADLSNTNQEELENELSIMENAEEIKSNFHGASQILKDGDLNTLNALAEAKSLLSGAAKMSEKYKKLAERLESTYLEIDDLAREVNHEMELIEFDPQETELVRDKLSKIYALQKKHSVLSVDELLNIEQALAEKVTATNSLDERIEEARIAVENSFKEVQNMAEVLSKRRFEVAVPMAEELQKLLSQLGMPNARIQIKFEKQDFNFTGQDEVVILFSANKGFEPQPIQKVASGGEFSRLIFCMKYILARKMALPTVVFDEIDTGVSGEIAMKLAEMMQEMSGQHQVITISHSPQIAARGNFQYFVYKDDKGDMTTSRIRLLSPEERILEIAKMIGGNNPPEAALQSAKSLLLTN